MSEIESAIVGYISGFLVGSLFLLVILGFVIVQGTEFETPDLFFDAQDWVLNYYEANAQIFGISFAFGFFMGLGSSGMLWNRK